MQEDPQNNKSPEVKNTAPFPVPGFLKEGSIPPSAEPPQPEATRNPAHRYIGMIVDFRDAANLCHEMEAQGMEVVSVNAFVQPVSPTQAMTTAFAMGRIAWGAPKTKLELDNEAAASRLIQPAVNRPNFNGHGGKK